MLKIYHMPGGRSARPVWTAEELGVPYQLVIKRRAELKLPDFLAINPLGVSPAIEDDGQAMMESSAIVEYLADRYDTGRIISPAFDSPERAAYLQWIHFAEATMWPAMWAHIVAAGVFTGGPGDQAAIAAAKPKLDNVLAYVENALARTSYIAADRFTAADIVMAWSLMILRRLKLIDEKETPRANAYVARLRERPAFQRMEATTPADWSNQPPGSVTTPPIARVA